MHPFDQVIAVIKIENRCLNPGFTIGPPPDVSLPFTSAVTLHGPRACWIIAFIYLACGALRLARFNIAKARNENDGVEVEKNFTGFPIPAAAGLIASITLFLLWLAEGEHNLGKWKFVLPPLLLFLSFMMFSRFQYPSFKAINWKTKKSIPRFLGIFLVLAFTVLNYEWMPAVLFLAYLLYGFLRPWLSREWRREIEEEIGDEEAEEPTEQIS